MLYFIIIIIIIDHNVLVKYMFSFRKKISKQTYNIINYTNEIQYGFDKW